ncbi:hypothetical protein CK203_107586 [Vitis vinifera]|uniref:Uncharacterized protein n=1 Tax=Vitis vinifera TaxID=29760 RepID=A0A438CEK3_VITVI|nr:hypothetical protein CK203_107586 [Vitis vinifera]
MMKFFDEIDENGNVRDNSGTSRGGREKQQTQCRGKEMKRLIEVLKPEEPSSEPEGHSKPCSDQKTSRDSIPAEGDEKRSFNQKPVMRKTLRWNPNLNIQRGNSKNPKKQRRIQVIDFQPQPMPKQIASINFASQVQEV